MNGLALKIYYLFGFAVFYCAPLSLILVLYHLIMKHKKDERSSIKVTEATFMPRDLNKMKTL